MQSPLFNATGASPAVRILQVSKELRRHQSLGYATAFVAVGLASYVEWLARDQYAGAPFLTIYPAIILATLIGGLGPGFCGAIFAGITQFGIFIPTLHWFAAASYSFDATLCVLLIDYINKTFDLLQVDVDREKQAKQHQYLLAKELHHRIQNLFTVIQAVIRFSLPGDDMIEESVVKQRLTDRLQSMAATNQAITDSMGDGVRLNDLIAGEIRGFEAQFQIVNVPSLVLGPQLTQNFSLILHELVINALKYGALSVPGGSISLQLDWTSSVLTMTWQERGGPTVQPPVRAGFGSRILGTLAKSFCRNVAASYVWSGFRYTLQIDSDQIKYLEPDPVAPIMPDAEWQTPHYPALRAARFEPGMGANSAAL
jgi:two-component sensor histidine kinase